MLYKIHLSLDKMATDHITKTPKGIKKLLQKAYAPATF